MRKPKPSLEQTDPKTFAALSRVIQELLVLIIAADERKAAAASGSNVVQFEKGARR